MSEGSREDMFQTQGEIRALLTMAGARPRRRYGQNFLVDRNLMRKLIEAAEVDRGDCVLEVGAGTGSLTGQLSERAGQVVSVEIDSTLAGIVREQTEELGNVRLIEGDALASKMELNREVVEAVRERSAGLRLKLVANLPYEIATPLVVDLLVSGLGFCRMCFTVQIEVADRFLARPGGREYGPVGIVSQSLANGRRICRAPPGAFWPSPRVESAMVRLDVKERPGIARERKGAFAAFVRAWFVHRRQMMGRIAREHGAGKGWSEALAVVGIDPKSRPEAVGVERWGRLFAAVDGR